MAYLLAKYTLLFLLTALLGFLLGRWWSRRSFIDVTESYESLSESAGLNDGRWNSLWQRLDSVDGNIGPSVRKELGAIPKAEAPVDLAPVTSRLNKLEDAIANLPIPKDPVPVDLAPVTTRLNNLETAIAKIPQPEKAAPVDFEPLLGRFGRLEQALSAIPKPEPQKPVSFDAVNDRLDKLERTIREIPKPEKPRTVDLQPLEKRLSGIEQTVRDLPKVETHPPVDLRPLSSRLTDMDQRIAGIKMPEAVDIGPLDRRLTAIELTLRDLRFKGTTAPAQRVRAKKAPTRKATVSKEVQPTTGPRLFKSPVQGKKDDLKKISGVGPKLERLLNKNGVYYFWQVSEWSKKDIDFIDERLQVFKGRISRDNWVSQAKTLQRDPVAAMAPG